MKLKKLGAFAATGAMALALALTGCGSSNATSGSDAGSSSSDDVKVEKVDGSKEYALVKDGTLTVGTSAEYAPFEYKDDNGEHLEPKRDGDHGIRGMGSNGHGGDDGQDGVLLGCEFRQCPYIVHGWPPRRPYRSVNG